MRAAATAPGDAPVIELVLIDKKRVKAAGRARIRRRGGSKPAQIARRLKQIVEVEQRPIYDKHAEVIRPIDYGDVALLLQALTNVTLYEEAFKAEGIPYLTIAGQGLLRPSGSVGFAQPAARRSTTPPTIWRWRRR